MNVDSQTQFFGNKRKLGRKNQWNPFILEKATLLAEAIRFSGNHIPFTVLGETMPVGGRQVLKGC